MLAVSSRYWDRAPLNDLYSSIKDTLRRMADLIRLGGSSDWEKALSSTLAIRRRGRVRQPWHAGGWVGVLSCWSGAGT